MKKSARAAAIQTRTLPVFIAATRSCACDLIHAGKPSQCRHLPLRTMAACASRARASDSYVRHGTERLDLSVTILVGSVRSGDERSAHLRTVPARFDSEANCFCGVHATGGKICHWGVSLCERSAFRVSAGCRSAFKSEVMALLPSGYAVNDTVSRVPRPPSPAANCSVPPICFVRD